MIRLGACLKRVLIGAALTLAGCDVIDAGIERRTREEFEADDVGSHRMAPADLPAFFDCLRQNSRTIVAAHRGGPAPGFAP